MPTVIKRTGSRQPFSASKITSVVKKCFSTSSHLSPEQTNYMADRIANDVIEAMNGYKIIKVEDIQDQVEKSLMQAGFHDAAKHYILFRNSREQNREPIPTNIQQDFKKDAEFFPTDIQRATHLSRYARWNAEKNRRETWTETVERVLTFFKKTKAGSSITEEEWNELQNAMLQMQVMPSMRVVQMAGPALDRCNVGVYNCAFLHLDSLDSLPELLYVLMQGTGVGFSVESDSVDKFPRVKKQKARPKRQYKIPDTTEGWCEALRKGLACWFAGEDIVFDYSKIRSAGTRLKTKGGQASGPKPLQNLLEFTKDRILANQGKRLSTLDIHDIACKCGQIVQVGGVRRAAQISLSDLDDKDMRMAKQGQFWMHDAQRAMANNSAVYIEKPSATEFMEEWLALAQSGSGERGIFNRGSLFSQVPKRRKKDKKWGVNPCGEIILKDKQFCNLSIVVARPDDTPETLHNKVRLATILGTLQSTLTNFNYISDTWKENCEEERLLGVDITGQQDCPYLMYGNNSRGQLLESLKETAIETNQIFAERLGISPSVAVTCVKPSGNSSQLFDCSSGLHPRYSGYYIRRVRMGSHDPLAQFLKDEGVPCHPETSNKSIWVFEFPVASPEGAITRDSLDAIHQLENWLELKRHWTEHNPSTTIYVKSDEWIKVANWVYNHWDEVGGLSFLPESDHVYDLAPYEEITQKKYSELVDQFPKIAWEKLYRYEKVDVTERATDYACLGDRCEI